MVRKISFAVVILFILACLFILGISASVSLGPRLPAKPFLAQSQIDFLETNANDTNEPYLNLPLINNKTMTSTMGLQGFMVHKGEAVDPWGYPYIFTKENNQIVVKSVGLERYEKMSRFAKWWNE